MFCFWCVHFESQQQKETRREKNIDEPSGSEKKKQKAEQEERQQQHHNAPLESALCCCLGGRDWKRKRVANGNIYCVKENGEEPAVTQGANVPTEEVWFSELAK